MFKAHVINDIEICPNFQPNLGCSHIFIFKKEKKGKDCIQNSSIRL